MRIMHIAACLLALTGAARAQSNPMQVANPGTPIFVNGYIPKDYEWTLFATTKMDIFNIGGDLYSAQNAKWNGSTWNLISLNAPAWLWQYNISNNMYGENYKAMTLWRAARGSNPIGPYTTVGGWLMALSFSEYGDFTLGSNGIEIDGNGSPPYGRFQHSTYSGENRTGLLYNAYLSEAWVDDGAKPSWFAGFAVNSGGVGGFRVRRAPAFAGAPAWVDFFSLDDAGNLAAKGYVAWGGGTYAVVSAWTGVPAGARSYVTDAVACATRLGAVSGGGSTFCPIVYSGSAWLQD